MTINDLMGYEKYWVLNGKSTAYRKRNIIKKYGYYDQEKKFWYLFTSPKALSYKELKREGLKLQKAA